MRHHDASIQKVWAAALAAGLTATVLALPAARAQASAGGGFGVERYEPTPAGEESFWVDHPWYSSTRDFAAGLTFDYSHDPLVLGTQDPGSFSTRVRVLRHQLVAHVDLAASFADRVTLAATLPVVLLERGSDGAGVSPNGSIVAGDPRPGVMVRLHGQPDRDAFSLNLGAELWIPIGTRSDHAGDPTVRVLPKVVLAGVRDWLRWSATGGFLFRSTSQIGNLPTANEVGNEVQLGGAVAYADRARRFSVGPEVQVGTVAVHFLRVNSTSAELLGGAHYQVLDPIQVGLAAGIGLGREPGTPDFRAIARVAWAPIKSEEAPPPAPLDTDGDGIPDDRDACPRDQGRASPDPRKNGCPDRDGDGVLDKDDRCPDEPAGDHPDPERPGCPIKDRDGDGVPDSEDQCPDEPAGVHPDPKRPGCPLKDTAVDADRDGVIDAADQCPDTAAGRHPDPARPGCPLADRDADDVPDATDACPDQPGAPSTDPKKNGCPGLVEVKGKQLVILEPVYFATNKDVILERSNKVLAAVAEALKAEPSIKRLAIDGHSDSRGRVAYNVELSGRRAKSVMSWLIAHGVEAERLQSQGYGPAKPVASNATAEGRAKNRRVEFTIIDAGSSALEP